jgi:chloramphenicol-sensitive protein RarD
MPKAQPQTSTPFYQVSAPSLEGIGLAVGAFGLWGLLPLYWKLLKGIPSTELLGHRIFWSFLFLAAVLLAKGRLAQALKPLRDKELLKTISISASLIAMNWLTFIWAVSHDRVLEVSLGYYANPLLNVLIGSLFFKEFLRRAQKIAVIIAALAVFLLALGLGSFPWVAIVLSSSFALYGVTKKISKLPSLDSLLCEITLLSPLAFLYLGYIESQTGGGAFRFNASLTDGLLMATALATATPLLLFGAAAKKVTLSTLGFCQYLAPTLHFLTAVFIFREAFDWQRLLAFILIWTAIFLFSYDQWRTHRKLGAYGGRKV